MFFQYPCNISFWPFLAFSKTYLAIFCFFGHPNPICLLSALLAIFGFFQLYLAIFRPCLAFSSCFGLFRPCLVLLAFWANWALLGLFRPFWAFWGLFGPFWAFLGVFLTRILIAVKISSTALASSTFLLCRRCRRLLTTVVVRRSSPDFRGFDPRPLRS